MERRTLYGPPGTGKTTKLLSILEHVLETVHPTRIAFVSFTKQGVNEGKRRAKLKFNFTEDDLPYFRTLHSLCFSALGCSREDTVGKKQYRIFSNKLGIPFTGFFMDGHTSTNDMYLHAMSMERHNPELAFEMAKELNQKKFAYVKANFQHMKQQLQMRDFDDMLCDYLEKGAVLPVKVAIIDEAQDLTPLQWQVAKKMFSDAETMIIAGDDDQAVFEWAGASIKEFLNFSTNYTVLDKSYRLPENIFDVASKVTKDIVARKHKPFTHNNTKGVVDTEESIKNISLQGGELVLARTNALLHTIALQLEEQGVFYKIKGSSSIKPTTKKAISAYTKYVSGELRFFEVVKYQALFTEMEKKLPWQQAINAPKEKVTYFERLLSSDALQKPPVLLETFHSCKGGEADHVVLCPALSHLVAQQLDLRRDTELRCLYVGLTRAKKRLTILGKGSETKHAYPGKYFNG